MHSSTQQITLLSTPAQRSLSEVHVMFCECYFLYLFFMAALCSGAKLLHVVDLTGCAVKKLHNHVVDLECE